MPGREFGPVAVASLNESVPVPQPATRRLVGLIRMTRFAAVGATGTVVNLAVMAALIAAGGHYVVAAIVAAEVSIVGNFLLQERFVFQDRTGGTRLRRRFVQAVGFNNLEALARLPLLIGLVELLLLPEVLAQALTLAAAFLLRFGFMSHVVYRLRPPTGPRQVLQPPVGQGPVPTPQVVQPQVGR